MWTRKAAAAAAVLLCAHSALADGVRVWVGGGGVGVKVGWHERSRREPPRREHRPRHHEHRREECRPQPAPCISERAVTLCIDGHKVIARVALWRDECGRVSTRVHLASAEPCGLPDFERITLEVCVDGQTWCPTLCRKTGDSRQAMYFADGGPRICERASAHAELSLRAGRDRTRVEVRDMTIG